MKLKSKKRGKSPTPEKNSGGRSIGTTRTRKEPDL